MEEKDPRHLLTEVAKILKKLKIPYIITGGMAVLVWGRPRFTADIDIVVELKSEDIDSLRESLLKLGEASYIDKNMIKDALNREGEFNFIHGDTGIKVDFWVLRENNTFELSRLKRKVKKSILGEEISFISPEDLILSKLEWYKLSQSSRHLEDIESVFRVSEGMLDKKYLEKWAEKLGFSDLLRKLKS